MSTTSKDLKQNIRTAYATNGPDDILEHGIAIGIRLGMKIAQDKGIPAFRKISSKKKSRGTSQHPFNFSKSVRKLKKPVKRPKRPASAHGTALLHHCAFVLLLPIFILTHDN